MTDLMDLIKWFAEHPGYINTGIFVGLVVVVGRTLIWFFKRQVRTLETHAKILDGHQDAMGRLTTILTGVDGNNGLRSEVKEHGTLIKNHDHRITKNEKDIIAVSTRMEP